MPLILSPTDDLLLGPTCTWLLSVPESTTGQLSTRFPRSGYLAPHWVGKLLEITLNLHLGPLSGGHLDLKAQPEMGEAHYPVLQDLCNIPRGTGLCEGQGREHGFLSIVLLYAGRKIIIFASKFTSFFTHFLFIGNTHLLSKNPKQCRNVEFSIPSTLPY